jgi:hypothetical protein
MFLARHSLRPAGLILGGAEHGQVEREVRMRRPRPVDLVVLVAVIALMVVSGYFGWFGLAIVE